MDELVYAVTGAVAARATPITLAEAGLTERAHLQEWVLAHPEMLGDGLFVVTSECDRWTSARGRERDRLDVLALDTDGHLVVGELKRGEAPETVELQAIKYAAYCSRFTPETLAEEHREWRARNGETIDIETALARLEGHLAEDVGGLAGAPLATPRIILLAGGFTPSTTAVAVWLREMGVDISLRAIRAYATATVPVISVSAVYPTPAVDEFVVSPLLAERRRDEEVRRAGRAEPAVRQLIAAGALEPGTDLTVLPAGPDAATFAAWAATGHRDKATWTGSRKRPLRWAGEDAAELNATGNFSVTGLVKYLYTEAGATMPAGAATQLVVTANDTTLAQLAGTAAPAGAFDWSALHRLMPRISAGRWATYGDVATVIGTVGRPLGAHVADCDQCENDWRLLAAGGRPSEHFRWGDDTDVSAIDVLRREGVSFHGDVADPAHQLTVPELQALLAAH